LNLTDQQQQQLDKIIKDSQERAKRVTAPFVREEVQRTMAEFRDLLTPEQRTKFDELRKHQQQQQRAREQRHSTSSGDHAPEPGPAPLKP
jgi:hypothetical protein